MKQKTKPKKNKKATTVDTWNYVGYPLIVT